jgi:hypothetical protein
VEWFQFRFLDGCPLFFFLSCIKNFRRSTS